jgi:branched-chain amino acid transport system ATP-binding protein
VDVSRAATHRIARAGVGWVPDDRRVFPALTSRATSRSPCKRTRFRAWTLKECCEIFSALEHLMARECENLSGGEMQMVAISRALLGAPGWCCWTSRARGSRPSRAGRDGRGPAAARRRRRGPARGAERGHRARGGGPRLRARSRARDVHRAAAELRGDRALRRRLLAA